MCILGNLRSLLGKDQTSWYTRTRRSLKSQDDDDTYLCISRWSKACRRLSWYHWWKYSLHGLWVCPLSSWCDCRRWEQGMLFAYTKVSRSSHIRNQSFTILDQQDDECCNPSSTQAFWENMSTRQGQTFHVLQLSRSWFSCDTSRRHYNREVHHGPCEQDSRIWWLLYDVYCWVGTCKSGIFRGT